MTIAAREQRQKNPESMQRANRKWREAHPEQARAIEKAWRENNREKNLADQRIRWQRWRANHPEVRALLAKKMREWRQANAEHYKEIRQRWTEANRDKLQVQGSQKGARKRGAVGRFTLDDLRVIFERQQACCNLCSTSLMDSFEIDHVIPVAKGGTHWPDNIQLLCTPCNRHKSDTLPYDIP